MFARPESTLPALKLGARHGALTAAATWLVLVLPAVIGWMVASDSTAGWLQATAFGSAAWFLAHGASVSAGGVRVALVPILLFLVFVWAARRSLARAATAQVTLSPSRRDLETDLTRGTLPGYLAGHLGWSVLAYLLTLAGPVRPSPLAILVTLLVPLVAIGWLLFGSREVIPLTQVDRVWDRFPAWFGAAWRAGWRGFLALAVVGLTVAVVRLATSMSEVSHLQGQLGIPAAAAVVLALVQLAYLGNAATWALAVLAGPGFQVGAGAVVSAGGANPGLVPLLPIFGGLPQQADFTAAAWLALLVPAAIGALASHWAWTFRTDAAEDRDTEDDAADEPDGIGSPAVGSWREDLASAVTTGLVASLPLVALSVLGTGALGRDRLSAVGPLPAAHAALVALVVAGALLYVAARRLIAARAASPTD